MTRLPILSGKELIRILAKMGFSIVRQEGSHVLMRHLDGRTTVVPNHPREDIDRGLLQKIMKKDLGMERDEFLKYV